MRTVGEAHPDHWPLEVLAEVMEEDLLKDIRYRRGLVYDLSALSNHFSDAGYFGIFTQVASQKRAKCSKRSSTTSSGCGVVKFPPNKWRMRKPR